MAHAARAKVSKVAQVFLAKASTPVPAYESFANQTALSEWYSGLNLSVVEKDMLLYENGVPPKDPLPTFASILKKATDKSRQRKLSSSLLGGLADSMKTAKDAKQMERVIVAYHESLTPIKGTAVSAVVKGMCRIGEADYALKIIANPAKYGVLPSMAVLNGLIARFSVESEEKPQKLSAAIDAWAIFKAAPTVTKVSHHTFEYLFSAMANAKSVKAVDLALELFDVPMVKEMLAEKGAANPVQTHLQTYLDALKADNKAEELAKLTAKLATMDVGPFVKTSV